VSWKSPFKGATSIQAQRLVAGAVEEQATGPQSVHCQPQPQETQFIHDPQTEESYGYQIPRNTATTDTLDALVSNKAVNSSTSAQYVVDRTTELNRCCAEDKAQVVTKYQADHLKAASTHHDLLSWHPQIVKWLKEGFPLSLSHPIPLLSNSFPPNNRTGAKLQATFVHEYIMDELAKGRLVGPYTFEEVLKTYGHFICSPLNVIKKLHVLGQPTSVVKWWLIIDCSVPGTQGMAVNYLLDLDDYPTIWDGAEPLAEYVSWFIYIHSYITMRMRGWCHPHNTTFRQSYMYPKPGITFLQCQRAWRTE
jgi:hypothetical protein